MSSGCQQGGCLTCSDYNGCLSCKPRFFMHLERSGMKQIGVCMTSCPSGFYGTRSRERNTCTSKQLGVSRANEHKHNKLVRVARLVYEWMDGMENRNIISRIQQYTVSLPTFFSLLILVRFVREPTPKCIFPCSMWHMIISKHPSIHPFSTPLLLNKVAGSCLCQLTSG